MESAELIALLHEVRDRVRGRNPRTAAGGVEVPLADLMPLTHARDAALGKVAAIGTVNPRAGGVVNSIVQAWKRMIARVLDWHVRDQVEFNRKAMACVDAALEAMVEYNRALVALGSRIAAQEQVGEELKDIRNHWADWRFEWEHKLQQNEIQFLRSVADLQGGFQHRVDLMDATHRDAMRAQHRDFEGALKRFGDDFWIQLERTKLDYERLIYSELKTIRQRAAVLGAAPSAGALALASNSSALPLGFDYGRFAERFRGTEEYVKAGQQFYLPHFEGRQNVLDIGCGRGEFLEMLRAAGVAAKGIDLGEESVATCRHKGLDAEVADLYVYLENLPEASLDGIFCSQVVEHLPPDRLPEMIRLCASRLQKDGVIAIETPNPECLAIFATHFYLDPTHQRPVPHPLLAFYLEEFGIGNIEVRKLSPAAESMPSVNSLPEDFRNAFFGGLDYTILGRKL
ncbi:MAG: class I SAM-dependent methyltransferase [Candidatus Solibacter sp.]